MDARLVAQALNYHGQQLQKVWEGERNENELAMLNLKEPNFEIYQQRQKTLRYVLDDSSSNIIHQMFLNASYVQTCYFFFNSFGDRGKRLKLQQFLAKKADALYDKSNLEKTVEPIKQELGDEGTVSLLSTHPSMTHHVLHNNVKLICCMYRFRILCNNARP